MMVMIDDGKMMDKKFDTIALDRSRQ